MPRGRSGTWKVSPRTYLWAAALLVVAGGRSEAGRHPDAEEAAEINDAIEALSADYRTASLALRHRSRFVERMKVEAEDQGLVIAIEKEWQREYERVRALEQVSSPCGAVSRGDDSARKRRADTYAACCDTVAGRVAGHGDSAARAGGQR